jgi:hypothetical protein
MNPIAEAVRILTQAGVLKFDPAGFDEAAQKSNYVIPDAQGLLPQAGQRVTEFLGLLPRSGEPLGSYWGRTWGSNVPPGLRQPIGRDIQLPKESPRKAKK